MDVCQRNVARFGHVECMFDKINDVFQGFGSLVSLRLQTSKHPHLSESVFTFKPVKLTPATVNDSLKYPDELSDRAHETKMMTARFVSQSSST